VHSHKYLRLLTSTFLTLTSLASGAPSDPQDTTSSLDDLLSIPVSTASRYAQLTREAPASVTLITSEEIDRLGFRTLAEAVSFVRGFYFSYDRDYTYLGVRGFSRPTDYNNRILLLLNGHPMNENVFESALIGTEFGIDIGLVDRIEVVRGPGSALYGSEAMFAVLNVITREGQNVGGVSAAVEAGSNRLVKGTILGGTRTASGIDLVASGNWFGIGGPDLYFPEYDTPEDNNGIARRKDWDRGFGVASIVSTGGWTFQGTLSERSKGIPTGAFSSLFNDDRTNTTDQRWSLDAAYHHDLGVAARLSTKLTFDDYTYEGGTAYSDMLMMDGSKGGWLCGEVNLQWDTHTFNRLDVGISFTKTYKADYRAWTEEGTQFYRDVPYDLGSIYLQNTTQLLSNLSLSVAARVDHHSAVGWMLSPRLALIYNPWETGTIKLLYGQAFRAPTVYEMYYGDDITQRANPGLKHERGQTGEIAVEQRLSHDLALYASAYQFRIEDLIDIVLEPGDSLYQYRNISEAKANGIELELVARFPSGIAAGTSAALQSATDVNNGGRLTNSPKMVIKVHCFVPLSEQISIACMARYESNRMTVYNTLTDAFVVADLHLRARHLLNLFDVSLLLKNLFNTRYAYPGGNEHLEPEIFQDRRTYSIRVGVSF
jgi:outer membrane receptor for ferrienterochelin and colicins